MDAVLQLHGHEVARLLSPFRLRHRKCAQLERLSGMSYQFLRVTTLNAMVLQKEPVRVTSASHGQLGKDSISCNRQEYFA